MASSFGLLCWIYFYLAPTLATSSIYPVPHTSEGITGRDFSLNQYNFNEITRTLNAMGARIGIPIVALSNIDLKLPDLLEISALDLSLVPGDYCFNCERDPSNSSGLVAVNETKILVICHEASESDPEWKFVSECKKTELMLLDFLVDLSVRGSRLAVPQHRLEKATIMNVERLRNGFYTCVPTGGHTACAGIRQPGTSTTTDIKSNGSRFEPTSSVPHANSPSAFSSATTSLRTFYNSSITPSQVFSRELRLRNSTLFTKVRSASKVYEDLDNMRTSDLYAWPAKPAEYPQASELPENLGSWTACNLSIVAPTLENVSTQRTDLEKRDPRSAAFVRCFFKTDSLARCSYKWGKSFWSFWRIAPLDIFADADLPEEIRENCTSSLRAGAMKVGFHNQTT